VEHYQQTCLMQIDDAAAASSGRRTSTTRRQEEEPLAAGAPSTGKPAVTADSVINLDQLSSLVRCLLLFFYSCRCFVQLHFAREELPFCLAETGMLIYSHHPPPLLYFATCGCGGRCSVFFPMGACSSPAAQCRCQWRMNSDARSKSTHPEIEDLLPIHSCTHPVSMLQYY
jgi:hypothetical protein